MRDAELEVDSSPCNTNPKLTIRINAMPSLKSDNCYTPSGTMSDRGYVYVIASIHGAKIGISICPKSRLIGIQTSLPFDVSLRVVFPVENMIKKERELHSMFKDKNIRGEWFMLDEDDFKYLETLVPSGFSCPDRKKRVRSEDSIDAPF